MNVSLRMFVVAFAVMTDLGAWAADSVYAEPVFRVNNSAAVSNDLTECSFTKTVDGETTDSSWAEFRAATDGTLVKEGSGWITITSDLSAFAGEIHVESGVLMVAHYNGLGSFTGGAAYVHDGASIYMDDLDGTMLPKDAAGCTKVLCIEGEGDAALGCALYAKKETWTGDSNWPLMRFPTLTDDATLVVGTPCLYTNWRPASVLRLNGHMLTLKRAVGVAKPHFQQNDTLTEAGHIVCNNLFYDLVSGADFKGGAENTLTLTNTAELYFDSLTAAAARGDGRRWTLVVQNGSYVNLRGGSAAWALDNTEDMAWNGPVRLERDLSIYNASAAANHLVGINLNGLVSGNGGIQCSAGSGAGVRDMKLGLSCPTNTFTGGVNLKEGNVLALSANGALPKDGNGATVTDGEVHLLGDDVYDLPVLNVVSNGVVSQVSRSGGKWKGVVKTGAGTLAYKAFAGADILEVREGTFRMPDLDYSPVAGLIKSAWTNGTEANAISDWNSDSFHPIETMLLADAAYAKATACGWAPGVVLAYRGYIRNPDPTNVMWSFASAIDWGGRLLIDGVEVLRNPQRWYPVRNNVDLSPGYHQFEYRMYAGRTGGQRGAYPDTDNVPAAEKSLWKWVGNEGFMLDRLGRESYDHADYEKPVDPGDGTLFVTTTNLAEVIAGEQLPTFGTMRFAKGTVFDFNGRPSVTQGRLEGFPTIASGDLTVTESWTVDALAAKDGGKLTTAGRLILADGAKLVVTAETSPRNSPEEGWTIAEAEGGIVLPENWLDTAEFPDDFYGLTLSADGKRLVMTHQRGMAILIR